jgi:protein Mpv17
MAPAFLAFFFSMQGLLAGESPGHIQHRLKEAYPSALKANYLIWPWVQLVNFYYVPLNHRVMVVNAVALGWNTWLSHTNAKVRH